MNVPPKVDPAKLELRARPAPVTRLNRRTLMLLVGGLAVAVSLVVWWALRPQKDRDMTVPAAPNVERVVPPEGLQRLPSDYRQIPRSPDSGPNPPAPGEKIDEPPVLEPAAQAETQRLQTEAEAAAKAQILVPASRTSGPSSLVEDDTSLPGMPSGPTVPSSAYGDAGPSPRGGNPAVVPAEPSNRIYGSAELQAPHSPYQLMAGTVIPAALLTAVNADLPGQVIAIVTEGVYDSVTGRHLLIPQGSRLIGEYDSQVAYGQQRVLLVWTRLIRPDGSSLSLDRLPATDTAGQAGLKDRVEWHWRRLLAGAALSTLVGVGAELAATHHDNPDGSVIIAAREGVQDTANQVGQQVTRRNLDLQPTLTIRAGYPLRVMVSRDLILAPYRFADIAAQHGVASHGESAVD